MSPRCTKHRQESWKTEAYFSVVAGKKKERKKRLIKWWVVRTALN